MRRERTEPGASAQAAPFAWPTAPARGERPLAAANGGPPRAPGRGGSPRSPGRGGLRHAPAGGELRRAPAGDGAALAPATGGPPRALLCARLLAWDAACVCAANRALARPRWATVAHWVSRLGNGELWVALILALGFLPGEASLRCAMQLAAAALVGVAIYKLVKLRAARPRPCARIPGLHLRTPPLDEHSFPSGHVLHAVSFAIIASAHFPALGWVLVPFAALTAVVRVVLGLHYPSDVAAGAVIGAAVAAMSFAVFTAVYP